MSKTPLQLHSANAEYAELRYPGDLAADVRGRTSVKLRRLRAVAKVFAANVAIAGGILFFSISHMTPEKPQQFAQPATVWSVRASCAIPSIQSLPALPSVKWSLPTDIPFPAVSVPWPSDSASSSPTEKTS